MSGARMLEVSGLCAGYDGRPVIHDLDLAVGPGEIVALVGANGAGKSTLARTLSGLLPALGGSIAFRGRDITRLPPAGRVRAGLIHVPEGRQVFAGLSVAQNIELGAYVRQPGETAADRALRLQAVLRQFPVMRERAGSAAGNLSGGQQQMLAIARGMMGKPQLLILDEPSLGLSPGLVGEIFRLIASLRAQGIAILLSEQNARMSLAIADRGYVLENGRVALSGEAAELMHSADIAARYLGADVAGEPSRLDDGRRRRLVDAIRSAAVTWPD
jgi:branched-chain amino acid transport system ATP-binding protein